MTVSKLLKSDLASQLAQAFTANTGCSEQAQLKCAATLLEWMRGREYSSSDSATLVALLKQVGTRIGLDVPKSAYLVDEFASRVGYRLIWLDKKVKEVISNK